MNYDLYRQILKDECDAATFARIEARAKALEGLRMTVSTRARPLSRSDVDALGPMPVSQLAKRLNVHRSTIYRALRRRILR